MNRIALLTLIAALGGCSYPAESDSEIRSKNRLDKSQIDVAADVAQLTETIKKSAGYRLANIEAEQTLPVLDYRVKDTIVSIHNASIFFSASEDDIAVIAIGTVQEAKKRGKNISSIQLMDGAVDEFLSRGIKQAKLGYFELYCDVVLKKM